MPAVSRTTVGLRRLLGLVGVVTVLMIVTAPGASADPSSFRANPTSGTAPLRVEFTSPSTDGCVFTYDWDFGDGGSRHGDGPDPRLHQAGQIHGRVVVEESCFTDSPRVFDGPSASAVGCDGGCWTSSTIITVTAAPKPPPTTPPPTNPPTDNSDSDSDNSNSDSDNSNSDSDNSHHAVVAVPHAGPTQTATPTPEPTDRARPRPLR